MLIRKLRLVLALSVSIVLIAVFAATQFSQPTVSATTISAIPTNETPVPEFSGLFFAAISALAATVYILRRRRK